MTGILVIDDNRLTTDAMIQMLNLWNLDAKVALNPATAMRYLQSETPRLIFLDINMPGLDGFEVLKYIKRDPRLASIPVIVVTSDDQPETKQKALAAGAATLIVKPVMPDILEHELRKNGLI